MNFTYSDPKGCLVQNKIYLGHEIEENEIMKAHLFALQKQCKSWKAFFIDGFFDRFKLFSKAAIRINQNQRSHHQHLNPYGQSIFSKRSTALLIYKLQGKILVNSEVILVSKSTVKLQENINECCVLIWMNLFYFKKKKIYCYNGLMKPLNYPSPNPFTHPPERLWLCKLVDKIMELRKVP